MLRDKVCEWCRDDRLHRHRSLRHGSLLDPSCRDIVQQQNPHLIAGHQLIRAVRTLHGNSDAVCIRVRRQHQISPCLLCERNTLLKRLQDLRIRIRAGSEVAVRILLLWHNRDVRDADVVKHMGDRDEPGSVQRRVYKLQSCCPAQTRTNLSGLDGIVERLLAVISDKPDQPLLDSLCK